MKVGSRIVVSRQEDQTTRSDLVGGSGAPRSVRDDPYAWTTWRFLVVLCFVTSAVFLVEVPLNIGLKVLVTTALGGQVAGLAGRSVDAGWRLCANFLLAGLGMGLASMLLDNLVRPAPPLLLLAVAMLVLEANRAMGRTRLLAVYGAATLSALLAAEWVLGIMPGTGGRPSGKEIVEVSDLATGRRLTEGTLYTVPDPLRGFVGRPNSRATVTLRSGKATVYHATYTLGPNGYRVVPRGRQSHSRTVLFFGDSFAFGQGVDDSETAPAHLVAASDGRIRCLNFGFIGYGPHQTLSILEHGLEAAEAEEPTDGVYYAAFDLARAVGRSFWDTRGPRYVPGPEGEPFSAGSFEAAFSTRLIGRLNRSMLFRILVAPRLASQGDADIYVSILRRSASLFQEKYGGQLWVAVLGEDAEPRYLETLERLRAEGLNLITPRDIFPGGRRLDPSLVIPLDGHPTPKAQALVAGALLSRIENPPTASSAGSP